MHCEILCIKQLEAIEPDAGKRKEMLDSIVAYVTLEPCMMCAYALNIVGSEEL